MKIYDIMRERYGDPERFVEQLRSRVKLHGITQGQLARRAGRSRSDLSRWLTENRAKRVTPCLEARVQLDEALDELIEGKA